MVFRVTPSYFVVISLYMTWLDKLGSGPLWDAKMQVEKERCLESWWTNILYINNYVNTENLVRIFQIPINVYPQNVERFVIKMHIQMLNMEHVGYRSERFKLCYSLIKYLRISSINIGEMIPTQSENGNTYTC